MEERAEPLAEFLDLSKSKQGPAVCLSLSGRAGEAALEINMDKLHSDTGAQKLITKLDSLFLKDSEQRIYAAHDSFEKFKRKDNISINDCIIEFEKLNLKLKEHKIDLPDAVLANRLLNNANIGHER